MVEPCQIMEACHRWWSHVTDGGFQWLLVALKYTPFESKDISIDQSITKRAFNLVSVTTLLITNHSDLLRLEIIEVVNLQSPIKTRKI